jgi:phospholipid/cholesterol/gamma-HCH transport system substrate-binding protein
MIRSRRTLLLVKLLAAVAVVAVAVTGVFAWISHSTKGKHVTAFFTSTVGIYPGTDVRILGVQVGTVETVQPQGRQVKVTLRVDTDVAVPANAGAVLVAPAVVSDRYVQLAPVYTGGQQLADNATIPVTQTATPVEIDQLTTNLNALAAALGPQGANKDGALSDVLHTGAANLGGNGEALRDTINQLGQATRTLSGSQDDLFGTVDALQKFTTMLAGNDGQVKQVNTQLAGVSQYLAGEREDLGAAMQELAVALGTVRDFIAKNRGLIESNVTKLAGITQVLVQQRNSLAETLDTAPLALDNVLNAYNPATHTIDARGNLLELIEPGVMLSCSSNGLTAAVNVQCGHSSLPPTKDTKTLPGLPLPSSGDVYGAKAGK